MKRLFIAALVLFIFQHAKACDICGCGVGNFNPHMFPHLSKNFVSFGYQYRGYHTHSHENGNELHNHEHYNTLSITGQYSPIKNLQLLAMVPFQVNRQSGPEGNKRLDKLGDIVLMTNYKIWDHTTGKNSSMVRQTITAGGGIKLATGKYQFDENNEAYVANSNFQAGTGSTDYLLNAYYSIRYKKIAISSGISYKINSTNDEGYRFGNRFQNLSQVKLIKDLGNNWTIIPSIGILAEVMQQDKQNGTKIEENHTGGYTIQGILGADLNSRKFALGLSYSASIKQNLADGHITANPGLNIHLSCSF